jgi:hypothetical protein
MENVLDPMNDGGSREAEDVEDALDTEEIRPSESEEDIQPQLERFGENGNIECQANSANVLIMSIDVVRMSKLTSPLPSSDRSWDLATKNNERFIGRRSRCGMWRGAGGRAF